MKKDSHESYASVDENGCIEYHSPGEVTISAELKNGVVREFTLTVIEEEVPVPASVSPAETTVHMKPGEQKPIELITDPSPGPYQQL